MAVFQAAGAFRLFSGAEPDTDRSDARLAQRMPSAFSSCRFVILERPSMRWRCAFA